MQGGSTGLPLVINGLPEVKSPSVPRLCAEDMNFAVFDLGPYNVTFCSGKRDKETVIPTDPSACHYNAGPFRTSHPAPPTPTLPPITPQLRITCQRYNRNFQTLQCSVHQPRELGCVIQYPAVLWLVVRLPGCRPRGPGYDFRRCQIF
jgi:hypothetical protein